MSMETYNIKISRLNYIGKGKDHVVFSYKQPNTKDPKLVVKIKQEISNAARAETSIVKDEPKFYRKLNHKWFFFIRSLKYNGVFPELTADIRLPNKILDITELNKEIADRDIQLSKEYEILVSSNLFFEAKSSNYESIFIEMKPKSLLKYKLSIRDVLAINPDYAYNPDFKKIYESSFKNKKLSRRVIYNKLADAGSDDYLLFNPQVFKNMVKKYAGTKYFEFKCSKENGKIVSQLDPREIHSYLGMSEELFLYMLQKIFFHKYEFYGHKKNVFDMVRMFQNLFPNLVSIFKNHMNDLKKLDFNDNVVKRIFKKAKLLISNNLKAKIDIGKLDESDKLLEAFSFMLISQVMSDCSIIVHIIQFHSEQDMINFRKHDKNYNFKSISGRFIGFKCNLIDTELKRFKKINYYLNKEEEFMNMIFNN